MLSLRHPYIMSAIRKLDYGLMPFYNTEEKKWLLVIKARKEDILTAKTYNSFRIYLIKSLDHSNSHLGLITAFFDDTDNPLAITTPLFSDDEFLSDIAQLFSQKEYEVYFFNENNYELLGAKVNNVAFNKIPKELDAATFPIIHDSDYIKMCDELENQFRLRTIKEDRNAYEMKLGERLYPDDGIIIDASKPTHNVQDKGTFETMISLERGNESGSMQEQEISIQLAKIFESQDIYLNPYREDTNKELTDILIVTDKIMFFIQTKDSPNTKEMLERSIDRKRRTICGHVKKATGQMRGALSYAHVHKGVTILLKEKTVAIQQEDKKLIGLILVKELFSEDLPECSNLVLNLVKDLRVPVCLLDYAGLHLLTQNLATPDNFLRALINTLNTALDTGTFPRSVVIKK